jgi:hypothetical protein
MPLLADVPELNTTLVGLEATFGDEPPIDQACNQGSVPGLDVPRAIFVTLIIAAASIALICLSDKGRMGCICIPKIPPRECNGKVPPTTDRYSFLTPSSAHPS